MYDQTVTELKLAVDRLAVQVGELSTVIGATLTAIVDAREADAKSAAMLYQARLRAALTEEEAAKARLKATEADA
jgi:hypothetical protein